MWSYIGLQMAVQVGQPEKDQNSANSGAVIRDRPCSSPVLLLLLDQGIGATTAAEKGLQWLKESSKRPQVLPNCMHSLSPHGAASAHAEERVHPHLPSSTPPVCPASHTAMQTLLRC